MLARAMTNALMWNSKLPKGILLFGDSEHTMSAMDTEIELNLLFNIRVAEVREHMTSWRSLGIEVDQLHHWSGASNLTNIAGKGEELSRTCKLMASGKRDLRKRGTHETPGQPPGTSTREYLRKKTLPC